MYYIITYFLQLIINININYYYIVLNLRDKLIITFKYEEFSNKKMSK